MPLNFGITGVAGYIAPRHLKAIQETGNQVVAAADPHDSVGILDSYSFDAKYFREIERFERHVDKLRRGPREHRIDYLSICSPNYLHDAHIRLALRNGADAICEKPLVINPWNLDAIEALELETGRRVFTVLQLRVHPALLALRGRLRQVDVAGRRHEVTLTYITARGGWFHLSWKGSEERSGGVATKIGVHFFDLLLWLFGPAERSVVHVQEASRAAGYLELARANVRWLLSVDRADLPFPAVPGGRTTHRSIIVDGHEVEFTDGFADLHTRVYERTLAGEGVGIADARPSIELAYRIRTASMAPFGNEAHPQLVEASRGS